MGLRRGKICPGYGRTGRLALVSHFVCRKVAGNACGAVSAEVKVLVLMEIGGKSGILVDGTDSRDTSGWHGFIVDGTDSCREIGEKSGILVDGTDSQVDGTDSQKCLALQPIFMTGRNGVDLMRAVSRCRRNSFG